MDSRQLAGAAPAAHRQRRRRDANPDVEITSVAGDKALAYVKRGVAVGDVPGPTSR